MIGLTPEQRRLVEQAGDEPVRLDDPEAHESFILVRQSVFERLRRTMEPMPTEAVVSEDLRRSQEAFHRDLPAMLKDRRLRGKYVAYHGDDRIGVAEDDEPLIRECLRRALRADQYAIEVIEPKSPEPEEVDFPSSWR